MRGRQNSHSVTVVVMICVLGPALAWVGCGESQRPAGASETIQPTPPSAPEATTPRPGTTKPTATTPETPAPVPTQPTEPAAPTEVKSAPKIEVENPEVDLGVIGPGGKHRCVFKFKNVGDGELKITRVTTTCSCTVPELTKKEYAPGESGTVTAIYHAGSTAGPLHKTLYIISNDPEQASVPLVIKGTIRLKVSADPRNLQLSAAKPNAGAVPIRVRCSDETPFAITNITATNDAVTFDYDPAKKATEFVLEPKVDIAKIEQSLNGYVRIQTSHPEVPQLTIPWTAQPCITLSQPRFILQNAEPGQAITRTVWVTNHCGGELKIASAKSTKGMMEIVSREAQQGHLKLEIRITPPARKNQVMRYISDALNLTFEDGRTATIYCTGWYKLK